MISSVVFGSSPRRTGIVARTARVAITLQPIHSFAVSQLIVQGFRAKAGRRVPARILLRSGILRRSQGGSVRQGQGMVSLRFALIP